MIDLHIHSYYSDGMDSPSKVIENAKRDGLKAVALTDHDCIWGLPEAAQKAKELEIEFIPGIELTASVNGNNDDPKEMHILGLFIKPSRHFAEIYHCVKLKKELLSYKVVNALQKYYGFHIDMDKDIRQDFKGIISMGSVGGYLLKHGYIKDFAEFNAIRQDLFALGIIKEKSEPGIPASEAIEAIHEVGGLAILAHPYRMQLEEQAMFKLIQNMVDLYGLNGLEGYYTNYKTDEAQKIANSLNIAKQLNLLVSGGSDYHEDSKTGRFPNGNKIPDIVLTKLKEEYYARV